MADTKKKEPIPFKLLNALEAETWNLLECVDECREDRQPLTGPMSLAVAAGYCMAYETILRHYLGDTGTAELWQLGPGREFQRLFCDVVPRENAELAHSMGVATGFWHNAESAYYRWKRKAESSKG